jgi:L-ascorbate metabolism protein UlaG (beta-lactamase superfamily)
MDTRGPLVIPGDATFDDPTGALTFIGTATVLVRYLGFTILTDPSFLGRGARIHLGYGLRATRRAAPAMEIDALPELDLVLLSQLDAGHFDEEAERKLDRALPIVTTPQASVALRKKGFVEARGLSTWEALDVEKGEARLRITAMPAQHGPAPVAAFLSPVIGSLLEFEAPDHTTFRIYVSGDTIAHRRLEEIPRRFPDIDLALLHLGGARIFGALVTMDGEQGAEALRIVSPRRAIPIHYDDWSSFESPLADFRRAVERAGLLRRVRFLARGETYRFGAVARTSLPAHSASAYPIQR